MYIHWQVLHVKKLTSDLEELLYPERTEQHGVDGGLERYTPLSQFKRRPAGVAAAPSHASSPFPNTSPTAR
jgi:hypothetical protein